MEFPAQMVLRQDVDHSFREQVALHTLGGQGAAVGRAGNVDGCQILVSDSQLKNASKVQRVGGQTRDRVLGPAFSELLTSDAELFLGVVHALFHSILQNPSG